MQCATLLLYLKRNLIAVIKYEQWAAWHCQQCDDTVIKAVSVHSAQNVYGLPGSTHFVQKSGKSERFLLRKWPNSTGLLKAAWKRQHSSLGNIISMREQHLTWLKSS